MLVLMVIAVGVLAASVLAWGTEYKVSLYHTHQRESRHPVPFAKLLSEKERPNAAHSMDAQAALQSVAAAFTLLLFVLAIHDPRRVGEAWILRLRPGYPARQTPCLSCFWFRPPPAPAR
jgi:hypothetical protein